MSRMAGTWLRIASLAVCMAGCDASPATLADSNEAASIANTAPEMHLAVGGSAPVSGQVLDQQGRSMPEVRAVFTSDDPGVAAVDTSGMVRGVSTGTANVTAAFGKARAVTRVTVTRAESPVRGFSLQADSVRTDLNGKPVEVPVRWTSAEGESECPPLDIRSDTLVAWVGLLQGPCRLSVLGKALGRAQVTVFAEGASDTLRVIVTAVASRAAFTRPDTVQIAGSPATLQVAVTDDAGNPVAGQYVSFAVTTGVATSGVSGQNGIAQASWHTPTDLGRAGTAHQVSFSATMPNGAVIADTVPIRLSPWEFYSYLFYRRNNDTGVFERIAGNTLAAIPGEEVVIGMRATDRYGNARGVYVGGGGHYARSDDYMWFEMTPYTARVCPTSASKDREGNAVGYTCVRLDSTGTVHVRAGIWPSCRTGCTTPMPYDLYVRFAAP